MASEQIYFSGTCKWAKVWKADDKYDKYTIDLYLDDESWDKFHASGLQLKVREDEDGAFVKFSRSNEQTVRGKTIVLGRPSLKDADLNDLEEGTLIGNGSTVTCRVEVYDSKNGKGHKLHAVKVDNLIVFDPDNIPEVVVGTEELPF